MLTANADLEQKIQSNTNKREIIEPAIQQGNIEENEATTTAFRSEIEELKKKVADQEETIDYLVQERDEASDQVYKLKLKLADAWNVTLPDDADKVREVARLVNSNERPKSYRDALKETDPTQIAVDSGIDIQSLEKLIDERVVATIEAKFEKHIESKSGAITGNSSSEFTKTIYTNKAEINDPRITQALNSDGRELNIIIHGLKENVTDPQTTPVVMELFESLGMKHHLTTSTVRLGAKSKDKIRPIRVTIESHERKQEFMSSLWRLKHGPDKFKKVSILDLILVL